MPEEPQHDPNVPDPYEPWCQNCKAHTVYEAKHHSTDNNVGYSTYICQSCNNKMHIAITPKFEKWILKWFGIWFPIIFLPAILIVLSMAGSTDLDTSSEVMTGVFFASGIAAIWSLFCVDVAKKMRFREEKWREWACKLGYVEEPLTDSETDWLSIALTVLCVLCVLVFVVAIILGPPLSND